MILSIIIVSYNTENLLKDCLTSIADNVKKVEHEIIVIDNNSSDGSVAMIAKGFPSVKIVSNSHNIGFAAANNQGYTLSAGRYVLLLNSDTLVLGAALEMLVDFMESRSMAGVIGPRILNPDMTLQLSCRRGFPRLMNSIAYYTRLSRVFPRNRIAGGYNMTYMSDAVNHQVDAVSGACMLVRRSIIGAIGGLLNEDYFMHFEDLDLCFRAKKNDYEVWYVSNSEVLHLKGRSSASEQRRVRRNYYDSAIIYFKKNYRDDNLIGYYLINFLVKCMRKILT